MVVAVKSRAERGQLVFVCQLPLLDRSLENVYGLAKKEKLKIKDRKENN